jgi:hypothetical protein
MAMLRPTRSILLILVALLYTATATAYTISIQEASCGSGPSCSYLPSDILEVDVVLDTEGETFYGFILHVWFTWDELWVVNGTYHPIPGEEYGSIYWYPWSNEFFWYITSWSWTPIGPVNQSIATLVFHVMDVPSSTNMVIYPNFDSYFGDAFIGHDGTDHTESVVLKDLVVHVPEPMIPLLLTSGVGLLILLNRLHQRKTTA